MPGSESIRSVMTKVVLITNGDLRPAANRKAWPVQKDVEQRFVEAAGRLGAEIVRGFPVDRDKQHGFIDSQRRGMEVFRSVDADAPLVVLLSTWQYSHHILHGLISHRGPILTAANWSGQYPGLVGLLNLNASLTKAGVAYSSIWSESFDDEFFLDGLRSWLTVGRIDHDTSHARPFDGSTRPDDLVALGSAMGQELREQKTIIGVFDEGCMGMFNAIVPDELIHRCGIFKERLSQSALFYEAGQVDTAEAERSFEWLQNRGVQFHFGQDEETELTRAQVLTQLRMYIAAVRIADDFGCEAIGIQYQQGLKDLMPASDLAEGLLNNVERPPVMSRDGSRELYAGESVPHFNEVDECAAIDALVTTRIWRRLGLDPANTLHDVRWGAQYEDEYVWVFEISGAAPPSHFVGGYGGASCMRQPPMYFRLGGATLRGVSRPGQIVWSRIFVEQGVLKADLGRGHVADLPDDETERRWRATSYEWPIMHAVLHGVSRDQLMARHKSNHVHVAYAPTAEKADEALTVKAAMLNAMGIDVWLCGDS